MNLTEQERREIRESLSQMSLAGKLEYAFTYYRLPIGAVAVALAIFIGAAYAHFTRKEPLLYVGYANIAVGDTLNAALSDGFVTALGENPRKAEVYLYRDLYLSQNAATENHEYAYASRLKTLATITSERFDVALMNREAYDLLSASGYLLPLPGLLARDEALAARLSGALTENTVVLEDNAVEYNLNEADAYEAVTQQEANALDVSAFPLFAQADFSGGVYLGVIGNSPRTDTALAYISYLTQDAP